MYRFEWGMRSSASTIVAFMSVSCVDMPGQSLIVVMLYVYAHRYIRSHSIAALQVA